MLALLGWKKILLLRSEQSENLESMCYEKIKLKLLVLFAEGLELSPSPMAEWPLLASPRT